MFQKHPLADTMSRFIEIDPDMYQDPEPEDQEYGYCVFKQLPSVSTVQNVPNRASP